MDVHVVAAARSKPVASAPASVGKPVASAGKRAKARVHVGECARGEWRGRAQESGESGEAGVCEGEGIRSALGEGVEDGEKKKETQEREGG